jgi:predicted nucleotidyltransferase
MVSRTERESGIHAALLRGLAETLPEATAIYLFGSTAAGDSNRSSDIDLAVLASEPIASERLARAREQLAEIARRDVDLLDLARVPTVMQAQIVSTGRVLRDADPAHRERFETTVYSAYAHLNEERREILERIQREGRVHGR